MIKEITKHSIKKFLILFLISILLSCSNHDSNRINEYDLEADKSKVLNFGECLSIKNKEYEICLITVNDSRCPSGGVCVWAGDAAVDLRMKTSSETKSVTLHTHNGFRQDTIINDLKIELLSVIPYPELHNTIDQEDYSIELLISEE